MVAPLAVVGPHVAREVAFEVLVPAVLEEEEALDELDLRLAGGVGSPETLVDRGQEGVYLFRDVGAAVHEDEPGDQVGMVGGEVDPDHGPERMPDLGHPIQHLPIHERDEVRGMGRNASRAVQPPRLSPATQIHGQEPPAR